MNLKQLYDAVDSHHHVRLFLRPKFSLTLFSYVRRTIFSAIVRTRVSPCASLLRLEYPTKIHCTIGETRFQRFRIASAWYADLEQDSRAP